MGWPSRSAPAWYLWNTHAPPCASPPCRASLCYPRDFSVWFRFPERFDAVSPGFSRSTFPPLLFLSRVTQALRAQIDDKDGDLRLAEATIRELKREKADQVRLSVSGQCFLLGLCFQKHRLAQPRRCCRFFAAAWHCLLGRLRSAQTITFSLNLARVSPFSWSSIPPSYPTPSGGGGQGARRGARPKERTGGGARAAPRDAAGRGWGFVVGRRRRRAVLMRVPTARLLSLFFGKKDGGGSHRDHRHRGGLKLPKPFILRASRGQQPLGGSLRRGEWPASAAGGGAGTTLGQAGEPPRSCASSHNIRRTEGMGLV